MWQADESEQHKPLIEEPHPGILKFSTSPLHSETKSQKKKDVSRRKVFTCSHYRNSRIYLFSMCVLVCFVVVFFLIRFKYHGHAALWGSEAKVNHHEYNTGSESSQDPYLGPEVAPCVNYLDRAYELEVLHLDFFRA